MRVFGIDPGSERTGYGCVDSAGRRHRLVLCGAVRTSATDAFPVKLALIHDRLAGLLAQCRPECVVIESLFHAANVRSALKLGHARGVAMLAAVEAGVEVVEYTPAEIKRAVVGYGRAEKSQVQQMIKLLLGLERVPTPHDAADALAMAICHVHLRGNRQGNLVDLKNSRRQPGSLDPRGQPGSLDATSWRAYRPLAVGGGKTSVVPDGGSHGPPLRPPPRTSPLKARRTTRQSSDPA
ncbi:MAG: crossover junction endodeoxyribonuclease RuvC [Vicinamibacterales bacterium]